MAQANFNIRAGKVAWRYTASAALFFVRSLFLRGGARPPVWRRSRSAYPKRSLLRCGLDICSISLSIHTKALPRPTTTPKNSNVRPGAVSMVNIHDAMQAAYQRLAPKKAASMQNTPRPLDSSRLSWPSTLIDRTGPRFSRRRRRDQPQTWTGRTCQPDRECTRRCTV